MLNLATIWLPQKQNERKCEQRPKLGLHKSMLISGHILLPLYHIEELRLLPRHL